MTEFWPTLRPVYVLGGRKGWRRRCLIQFSFEERDADDSLVPAFEARMMAGYEEGVPLQQALEVSVASTPTSSTGGGSRTRY